VQQDNGLSYCIEQSHVTLDQQHTETLRKQSYVTLDQHTETLRKQSYITLNQYCAAVVNRQCQQLYPLQ